MKITDIKTHKFKTTTTKRDVYKYGYWFYPNEMLQRGPREITTTILELVTDTGISGYWIGDEPAEWVYQLAIGEDPLNREWLWINTLRDPASQTTLDMLLWDFAGRYFETPVHRLLGGYRDKVKCYASSYPNMGSPEVFADHAEECVKKGYLMHEIRGLI